ncbi:hypothetical protein BRADI_4g24822v3 [Brachypodium distachyon]|uniref:Uncharacterized protein n=1 Tax=Brachypodium distachyon TaxID=15368 RepID=A0A2K2CQ38_BRADI|nr:hypothetical protein BRADI_4g24822v3 [Brachypodium distachyon]
MAHGHGWGSRAAGEAVQGRAQNHLLLRSSAPPVRPTSIPWWARRLGRPGAPGQRVRGPAAQRPARRRPGARRPVMQKPAWQGPRGRRAAACVRRRDAHGHGKAHWQRGVHRRPGNSRTVRKKRGTSLVAMILTF